MINKLLGLLRLNPDYNNRVFGLDLMRALAIIFVVMGHGLMLEKANTNFPWIRLINGVELFFVLSGFLIGSQMIFQQKYFNYFFKVLDVFYYCPNLIVLKQHLQC